MNLFNNKKKADSALANQSLDKAENKGILEGIAIGGIVGGGLALGGAHLLLAGVAKSAAVSQFIPPSVVGTWTGGEHVVANSVDTVVQWGQSMFHGLFGGGASSVGLAANPFAPAALSL